MGAPNKPASTAAKGKKETHPHIYAALAAFQAEAPKIEKTKQFGKEGESMHFKYASLDDVLEAVRPITSKHGLSFTWEGEGSNMVCVLYHETYSKEYEEKGITVAERTFDAVTEKTTEPAVIEKNVLRSLPVEVSRKGDMKAIGNNSTYARRYTICEVLGLAAEEDKDASLTKESGKNAQKFTFTKAKQSIEAAKDVKELEKQMKLIDADMKKLEEKKAPTLGLKLEDYQELQELAAVKNKELLEDTTSQ